MKKLLKPVLTLFALIIFSAPVLATTHAELAPGAQAPAFTLDGMDGAKHSLSDYAGKIVVLEWTNHECPYVKKHYETGNMQKLQAQATAHEDVVWLTINSSASGKQGNVTAEQAQEITGSAEAKATAYLFDASGETGMAYGAKTTPHMYVIDKEGKIAYMGAIDDNPSANHETVNTAKNYVTAALDAVREGKAPEVQQSKPYGCGVKYESM